MVRAGFEGAILLVEGDTDCKLLERFVDSGTCKIVCARGKENVVAALGLLEGSGDDGIVGFVDSDFDRFDGLVPTGRNIVVCDCADVEMMLLSSPALEKVLNEFGSGTKMAKFLANCCAPSIREHLMSEGAKLASLRYQSKHRGWRLRFKELDYGKFVDARCISVDVKRAVRAVIAHTGGPAGVSAPDIEAAVSLETSGFDLSEYCSGHDCCWLLAIGLRQALASQPQALANKDAIERLLRLAYEDGFFANTHVYAAIRAWEAAHYPFRVLRDVYADAA